MTDSHIKTAENNLRLMETTISLTTFYISVWKRAFKGKKCKMYPLT